MINSAFKLPASRLLQLSFMISFVANWACSAEPTAPMPQLGGGASGGGVGATTDGGASAAGGIAGAPAGAASGSAGMAATVGGAGSAGAAAGGSGGVQMPPDESIPFQDLKSVSYTNGCGNKPTNPGTTTEVTPGRAYDLSAYGLEMGFHCDIDHGHFAYIEIEGDFEIVAQLEALATQDGVHHSRAGLMARKLPAAADDMFVSVTVTSNYTADHFADLRNWAVRMEKRAKLPGNFFYHVAQEDAEDHHSPLPFPRKFPNEWLRLQRIGNKYMAWYGDDGLTWREHRRFSDEFPQGPGTSWTVDLGQKVALGLSLEASPEHSWTTRANARFRNIKLTKPKPE
jgi:hypothetical protein